MRRRPVLVLHDDARLHQRIRSLPPKEFEHRAVQGWSDLIAQVADAPPSALVVVGPYVGTDPRLGIAPELQTLLLEFPSTAVIAALEVSEGAGGDLKRLGKLGVVDVISLGHDDTLPALAARFHASQGAPLRTLLEQVLPSELPGRARAILDAAAAVVAVGGGASDLAGRLGLSRRTLLRWCLRAGLPPARRLLAWMRILLAAEMLDDRGRRVLSVAHATGYSSDAGLRRVMLTFVGSNPSELRKRGAFAAAAKQFLRELAQHRSRSARERH